MTDIIAQRGPDGAGHWTSGPVGLGQRMLCTTSEQLAEKQPLANEAGDVCLIFDGRVDNREELRAALEKGGVRLRDNTDAELILRAYELWERECPQKIIGDFAFVIWNERKRELYCARDVLGLKPLYYYYDGRKFVCGSELRQLFADPSIPREPNEGMVGEYLAAYIVSREETLFKNILKLMPAHYLVVSPQGIRQERYWDINPRKEIRYRTDEEYAEHFKELLNEVVRCHWRSHKPVAVSLSGGLDSSAITGVAASLRRNEQLNGSDFECFSLYYPQASGDEREYIKDVVSFCGLRSHLINSEEVYDSDFENQARAYLDVPEQPNHIMFEPLKAAARASGSRVLIHGTGGDEWLNGSWYHMADLARQLKPVALFRQIYHDARTVSIIYPKLPIIKLGIWPLLPFRARRILGRTRRWINNEGETPTWINEHFASRVNLSERLRRQPHVPQFSNFAQKDIYTVVNSGSWLYHIEMADRAAARSGLEERMPFLDRRIMEFAIALPEDQRWRKNEIKFILRQAVKGRIPESVRQRVTKGDFSFTFPKTLHAQGGAGFFERLRLSTEGWVNEPSVLSMYRQMTEGFQQSEDAFPNPALSSWMINGTRRGYTPHMRPLWMIFAVEMWLRAVISNEESLPMTEAMSPHQLV